MEVSTDTCIVLKQMLTTRSSRESTYGQYWHVQAPSPFDFTQA
jgi:hypothetical protein